MKENEVRERWSRRESQRKGGGSEPGWGSPTKDHAISSAPAAQTRGLSPCLVLWLFPRFNI